MADEQKNGPNVNPIQDLPLPAYAMVNGIQVQLFKTIDEYALKTIKKQSAPVKIVVFTKRNMDNYDTIIYSAAEFLNEYPSVAMQNQINSALELSEKIKENLNNVSSIVAPTIGGNLTDTNKKNLTEIFRTNESLKGNFTKYISNIKQKIEQITSETLKTNITLIDGLVEAKSQIQLMINSAMGKINTIPIRNFFNKLLRRSDKKQVVQNLVKVLENINGDLNKLVEAVIYIQIKEPFNWDSLIEQYNLDNVSTRYLNDKTRQEVETYLHNLVLIYEQLQLYGNNEFIDKLRCTLLTRLIDLLDTIISVITRHLQNPSLNDQLKIYTLLNKACIYTNDRINYYNKYSKIQEFCKFINKPEEMDKFELFKFKLLKERFKLIKSRKVLSPNQEHELQEVFTSINHRFNPEISKSKDTTTDSTVDKSNVVTDLPESSAIEADTNISPISDDDAVAAAVTEAEAEVPVESALDASVPVTSETAPVASDESVPDVSASDEPVPDEPVPESVPDVSASDVSAPVRSAPIVSAPDVSVPVVTAPVGSESESQTTPWNERLKQVQDAYNPAYEQLLSLNTNTIFSKDYDINPLYTSWANAFAVIKGIINVGHIPDENKKYICLVKINTTALYTILYAVIVNKYIQDKFKTIQSILLENTAKNTIDIRKQIVFILEKWNAIYGKLRLMINQMKMIDPANNKKANNTLKKLQSIDVSQLLQLTNELTTELSRYNKAFNPTWWNTVIHPNKYNTIKEFFTKALEHLTEINDNTNELVQDIKTYSKLMKHITIKFPIKYTSTTETIIASTKTGGGKLRSHSPFRSRSSRKAK